MSNKYLGSLIAKEWLIKREEEMKVKQGKLWKET